MELFYIKFLYILYILNIPYKLIMCVNKFVSKFLQTKSIIKFPY